MTAFLTTGSVGIHSEIWCITGCRWRLRMPSAGMMYSSRTWRGRRRGARVKRRGNCEGWQRPEFTSALRLYYRAPWLKRSSAPAARRQRLHQASSAGRETPPRRPSIPRAKRWAWSCWHRRHPLQPADHWPGCVYSIGKHIMYEQPIGAGVGAVHELISESWVQLIGALVKAFKVGRYFGPHPLRVTHTLHVHHDDCQPVVAHYLDK